jgi:hypothetical protein
VLATWELEHSLRQGLEAVERSVDKQVYAKLKTSNRMRLAERAVAALRRRGSLLV